MTNKQWSDWMFVSGELDRLAEETGSTDDYTKVQQDFISAVINLGSIKDEVINLAKYYSSFRRLKLATSQLAELMIAMSNSDILLTDANEILAGAVTYQNMYSPTSTLRGNLTLAPWYSNMKWKIERIQEGRYIKHWIKHRFRIFSSGYLMYNLVHKTETLKNWYTILKQDLLVEDLEAASKINYELADKLFNISRYNCNTYLEYFNNILKAKADFFYDLKIGEMNTQAGFEIWLHELKFIPEIKYKEINNWLGNSEYNQVTNSYYVSYPDYTLISCNGTPKQCYFNKKNDIKAIQSEIESVLNVDINAIVLLGPLYYNNPKFWIKDSRN